MYTGANQKDAVITVNGKQYMMAADGQDISGVDKGITVILALISNRRLGTWPPSCPKRRA